MTVFERRRVNASLGVGSTSSRVGSRPVLAANCWASRLIMKLAAMSAALGWGALGFTPTCEMNMETGSRGKNSSGAPVSCMLLDSIV